MTPERARQVLDGARAAVEAVEDERHRQRAERDRRTADHIAAAIRIGSPVTSRELLSTRGSADAPHRRGDHLVGPTPEDLRRRFELALQDLRERRLCAHAPHGWPVLSLSQEALVCRIGAMCRQGGEVVLSEQDAREVAHLLDVLSLLARAEWAEAASGGG